MRIRTCILGVLASFGAMATLLADDKLEGVFSNSAEGFGIITLMVHEGGMAYFHAATGGLLGEWKFDDKSQVLALKVFDDAARRDESLQLKFDPKARSYTILLPEGSRDRKPSDILTFISQEIPKEVVASFEGYPERVKKLREEAEQRREAQRKWRESGGTPPPYVDPLERKKKSESGPGE